jgi:hypothetical protein
MEITTKSVNNLEIGVQEAKTMIFEVKELMAKLKESSKESEIKVEKIYFANFETNEKFTKLNKEITTFQENFELINPKVIGLDDN